MDNCIRGYQYSTDLFPKQPSQIIWLSLLSFRPIKWKSVAGIFPGDSLGVEKRCEGGSKWVNRRLPIQKRYLFRKGTTMGFWMDLLRQVNDGRLQTRTMSRWTANNSIWSMCTARAFKLSSVHTIKTTASNRKLQIFWISFLARFWSDIKIPEHRMHQKYKKRSPIGIWF